jgi:hypothetical protein
MNRHLCRRGISVKFIRLPRMELTLDPCRQKDAFTTLKLFYSVKDDIICVMGMARCDDFLGQHAPIGG